MTIMATITPTMMMMRHTVAIQEAARVAERRMRARGFSFAAKTRNTFNEDEDDDGGNDNAVKKEHREYEPTGETRKNWKSLARYQVQPAHIVSS